MTRNPWLEVSQFALNPDPDGKGFTVSGQEGDLTWTHSVTSEGFGEMVLHASTLDAYSDALELLRQTYPVCREHGINVILEGALYWSVDPYLVSRWHAGRGWPVFMFAGFHTRSDELEYCIALRAQGLPDGSVVLADAHVVNLEPRSARRWAEVGT